MMLVMTTFSKPNREPEITGLVTLSLVLSNVCLNQAHLGSFQPFNVDHFHTYISRVLLLVFSLFGNSLFLLPDVIFFGSKIRSGEVGRARARPLGPLPELRGHLVDPHQADLLLNGADGAISAESRDEEPLDHLHLGFVYLFCVFFLGGMFWAVMLYRLYLYISFHFWPPVSFAIRLFESCKLYTFVGRSIWEPLLSAKPWQEINAQTLHPTVTQNLERLLFLHPGQGMHQ